ncbi:MAG: GTP cyclohydrolase I, partial [Dehalococcoidales bacterium]
GRIVGISKLARVVEIIAKRPQIQEKMTTEIADVIMDAIKPDGVAVVIQAEHLCMIMRGIEKPGSNVITSAVRGGFKRRAVSRAEFFSLIQGK